jgi:dephospho-CoA kinase
MSRSLRIGLTGGIGSGKTTASNYFASLGVPVIDTDELARELVEPGTPALEEVVAHFGKDVLNTDGTLNRQALRAKAFSSDTERQHLEDILHPRIRDLANARAAHVTAPYCIIVIPLLLETPYPIEVDRVLLIDAADQDRHRWVKERDGLSDAQLDQVLNSQASRAERLRAADDVVVNRGGLSGLHSQLDHLHAKYLRLAQKQ